MITLSICIEDLDMAKATLSKNGKKYLNLVIDKRKEVGKFGDTHSVTYSQSKEQREAKQSKEYVKGATAKEYVFGNRNDNYKPVHQSASEAQNSNDCTNNLPF